MDFRKKPRGGMRKVVSKPPKKTGTASLATAQHSRGRTQTKTSIVHNDAELDPSATEFPPRLWKSVVNAAAASENRTYTLELGSDTAITTDGSGLLQNVTTASPVNASNWSSFQAVFDEYRVLAVRLEFKPLYITGGSSASFQAPISHVIDRDSSAPLTSYTLASRYTSCRETPGQKPFKQTIFMASPEESDFVSMGTTKTLGWFLFYSSGNSLSTTVGRIKMTYIVQFRGLGIA